MVKMAADTNSSVNEITLESMRDAERMLMVAESKPYPFAITISDVAVGSKL